MGLACLLGNLTGILTVFGALSGYLLFYAFFQWCSIFFVLIGRNTGDM